MGGVFFFFFQGEDGIRDHCVTGVQTCALPIFYPYIRDGLRYLSLTQQGKQIIANLYSNVFVVEHEVPKEEQRYLEVREVGMKELPNIKAGMVKTKTRIS